MAKTLKVWFVDFWLDMNKPQGNFFYEILSTKFSIEFSDKPDLLFYSCFGNEHLNYSCTRIFFSTENWRPNFEIADYAITFDYLEDKRHLRMPLWALYYSDQTNTQIGKSMKDIFNAWLCKSKFCCILVSNPSATQRIDFFHKLNSKLVVDSAGKWNNNIGTEIAEGTHNKLKFISDYRFVISFENSTYPGYTTEKILEPLLVGSIPIYWGDPLVGQDFNLTRFVNVKSISEFDDIVLLLEAIENDKSLAKQFFRESFFANGVKPKYLGSDYLSTQLFTWIEDAAAKEFRGAGSNLIGKTKFYGRVIRNKISKLKGAITQRKKELICYESSNFCRWIRH